MKGKARTDGTGPGLVSWPRLLLDLYTAVREEAGGESYYFGVDLWIPRVRKSAICRPWPCIAS